MDRGGDPGAHRRRLPAGAGAGGGPDSPAASGGTTSSSAAPSSATARPICCPWRLQKPAGPHWRPASRCPSFRAELTYRVTYNEGGLWSLYTQSRESRAPAAGPCSSAGETPGIWPPAIRWPCPPSSPAAAAGSGGCWTRWRRRSGSRRRPASPGTTRAIRRLLRQAFQPAELLSDRGGAGRLLSHVRHRPGGMEGIPVFTVPLWPERTGAALPAEREAPLRPAGRAEGLLHPEDVRYFRRVSGSRAALATRPLRASSASRLGNTIRALNRSERFQTSGASSMEPRATHTTAMQA